MAYVASKLLLLALVAQSQQEDECSAGSCGPDVLLLQVGNEVHAKPEKTKDLAAEAPHQLSAEVKAPNHLPADVEATGALPDLASLPPLPPEAPVQLMAELGPRWFEVVVAQHAVKLPSNRTVGSGDGFRLAMNFSGIFDESTSEEATSWKVSEQWARNFAIVQCLMVIPFLIFWRCAWIPTPQATPRVEDAPEGGSSSLDIHPNLGKSQVLCLAQVAAIGCMSQDIYIPNMVEMAESLGVSQTLESLTLEVNWITSALTCLVIGALSDKYGRRPALLGCFTLYILGSAMAAAAPHLWTAILARILQGSGEACMVLPLAIMRDLISDVELRGRVNAVFSLVSTAGIVMAPVIGGAMGTLAGWRSVFVFLSLWGFSLFVFILFCMPESNPKFVDPGSVAAEEPNAEEENFMNSIWEFVRKFREGGRSCAALLSIQIFFSASIMSMLCSFPFVIEDQRGLSTAWCSFFMIFFAVFVMVGVYFNLRLKDWFDFKPGQIIATGLNLFTLAGLGFLLIVLFTNGDKLLPLVVILIPPCILTFSGGIMNGPINAKYIEFFGSVAGTASGATSALNSALTSVYAYVTTAQTETHGEIGWGCTLATGIISGAVIFRVLYEPSKSSGTEKVDKLANSI